jgi:transposase-like protein
MMGFKSFHTARRTLSGYETMNMIRKSQVQKVAKGDIVGKVKFIADIFRLVT